jgi:hypothetical protein
MAILLHGGWYLMALAHLVGPQNLDGYTPYEKGYHFTAPAGQMSYFLTTYTEDLFLQGVRTFVGPTATMHDYMTFDVVDHDNLLGYGVDFVLCTMADTLYVHPDFRYERIDSALKDVFSWLYLRHGYCSDGTEDVDFIVHHVFRKVPENA